MNLNKNINLSGGVGSQNRDTKSSQLGINQSKVGAIKTYSSKIVSARARLSQFLLKKNIKLLTSFTEYVTGGSFLNASYIVYLDKDNKQESLATFIERNPNFKEIVEEIELELRNKN
ncbi:MAG: hypothetical protein ACRCXZ_07730 [Patescibacteria group bacterium]